MSRTTIEETYALIQDLKVSLLPSFVLFHNNAVYFPKILAVIVYLWSQIQIFMIISKATIFGLDEKTSPLIKVIQQLYQTLYMENLLSFEKSWGSDLAILILITLFLLLIGVMIGYILVVFFMNITPSTMIVGMLSFILRMHPFILFYPVHIIALQVLSYSDQQVGNSTEVQPIEEQICFGLGIAIVIMNTLYSLAVLILLEVRTRTRSLISTKTILPNIIEFLYKFAIPFFWSFSTNDNLFSNVILIVSLIYCLIRAWFLFGYLPYYKLSMLRLEAVVQALIIALAFAAIISSITNYYRLIHEFLLFTLLWILLSLCFGFLYLRLLEYLWFQIILNPTKLRNKYYLIHFFAIYKAISKSAVLGLSAPKLNKWYFDYISFIGQSDASHLLPSKSEIGWTVERQTALDRHFFQKNIKLLEKFIQKNPEADLVKVTLAYYYAKNEDSFILATHILNENARLANGVGHSMQLVKLTILQKLQAKENSNISSLTANHRSENGSVNIQNYLKVQETFKNLKIRVIDQVANQINFWKDFQGQNPDFFSLKTLALQVYKKAYSIKQLSKRSRVFMKAGYSEPLLTLGLYFCFVQNDVFLGQKFISEYYNLESRNKQKNLKGKVDKSSEIALEFPYLVIATSQNHLGKIIDCYGKIKPTLGFERETLVGKSINVLMPSSYAKYHDTFIRDSFQNTHPSVLNKAREVVLLRPDNYLILCRLYLSLRYLPEHGLCFSAVIRPLHDRRRLVLISEKGIISNFSENFRKDMGIRDPREQSLNIFYFCPELERVLRDFKILARQTLGVFRGRTKTREDSKLMFMPSKLSVNEFPTETFNQTETPKVKSNDPENVQSLYTVQTKEINLTFCPQQNLRRNDSTRTARSGKQVSIVYEAEIKKVTIQNVEIFELKMKKASNINGLPLLTHQDTQQDYVFQSARNTMMSSTHRSTYQNPKSPKILKALDTMQSQKLNLKSPQQLNLIYLDDFGAKATEENYLLTSPGAKGDKDVSLISAAPLSESMNEVSKPNPETGKHQAIQIPAKALLELDTEIYQESQPPMEESFRMSNSSESEDEKMTIAKIIPGVNDAVTEGIRSNHPGLGIENFKGIATQKLLREIIESDKPNKATKYYHSSFIVTLVYLVAFLVWLNMYTASTSKVIGNLDEVLSETSFRNYWTNTANQETRIWVGKRTLITSSSIAATIQSNNKSYQKVNEFNQNLRTSLGLMEDDILHLFNSRNISTYERNASILEFVSRDDSFQVTNKIVNDGLNNVNKPVPDVVIGKANNPQTQFIFDNSCNDLLVTSENLIDYLQDSIFDIIQSSRKNINITFVITLVVLVAFSIISLVFVIKMNREFKVFMEVLFGLSLSKIKQTEIFLSKFSELINKESSPSQLLRLSRITREKEIYDSNNSSKTKINNRKTTHTASMKRIYRRNYLNFLGLFCALQCIVGFIIIYYSYAINKLNIMRKQHVSINTALKYINTLALTSIGAQAMVMDISPITIRNIPVAVSLEGDLGLLKNISYLEDSLKDDNDILSSRQQEIFSNITCDNVYSPLYSLTYQVAVRTCVTASNGLNRTGLIKALTNITTGLTQYLYDYSVAVKNDNTTQQFFQRFYSNLLTPINLGSTLLLLAYTSANNDFVSLVKELEKSRILLAWIACLVTIILGSVTWFFVIRKLVRKELEKRKMLSLIPIQLIFESLRFRKYIDELAKDSGHQNLNLSKY